MLIEIEADAYAARHRVREVAEPKATSKPKLPAK